MGRIWTAAEGWANRVGIWFTWYLAMSALFGWLSSHLDILKPYGWAEATIAGFLLASLGALVLSAVLVAWRFFNPLHPASPKADEPEPDEFEAQIIDDQSTLFARVEELGKAVSGLLEIQRAHVSTPILREDLVAQIERSEKRFIERLETLEARSAANSDIEVLDDKIKSWGRNTVQNNYELNTLDHIVPLLVGTSIDHLSYSMLFNCIANEATFTDEVGDLTLEILEREIAIANDYCAQASVVLKDTRWGGEIEKGQQSADATARQTVKTITPERIPEGLDRLQLLEYYTAMAKYRNTSVVINMARAEAFAKYAFALNRISHQQELIKADRQRAQSNSL